MQKPKLITAFNETKTLREWYKDARRHPDISYDTIRYRIAHGMSPEEAITKHKFIYEHNTKYFSEWNNENAWIIGFIAADGCIAKNTNCLKICVSIKDICILEHIRDNLSPNMKINTRYMGNGSGKSLTEMAELFISCANIVKDLRRYNIYPQKTGNEKLPQFPNKDIAHRYLLGLIDGDGCIERYRNKYTNGYNNRISICSSNHQYLEDILEYFDISGYIAQKSNSECYEIRIYRKNEIIRLYYELYKNNGFYLKRKKDKLQEIVESYK